MITRICVYGFGKAIEWAFADSKPTQKDRGVARRYQSRHRLAVEILDRDTDEPEAFGDESSRVRKAP